MPTVSWLNGTSGDWGDPTQWNTGTVPNDPTVDVVIDAAESDGSYTVAVDPGATYLMNSLTLDAGLDASGISDSGSLLVAGSVDIEVGLFNLSGALAAGSVEIDDGLALAGGMLNADALTIAQSGVLSGYGTVAVSDQIGDGGLIELAGGNLTLIASAMTLDGGQLDAATGTLTLQVASFSNLSGGILTGGNYEADDGGVLMLPADADITALQDADLFLIGSGTIAYLDSATGSIQAIQAELQTIDPESAILIVSGATFAVQNPLLLGGRIDIVDGQLSAPGLTIDPNGLLSGVGTVVTDNGIVNNGEILSGTGVTSSLGDAVGDLVLIGAVTGTGSLVLNVGTLELTAGSTEAVSLLGGGTLRIDSPITEGGSLYIGTITNVGATRSSPSIIDLPGLAPTGLTFSYTQSAGSAVVDAVTAGATLAEFDLAGSYYLNEFTLGDDQTGGTDVIIACYAAGTRIRTPGGEVAVETLRPADLVLTSGGEALPVTWLGHRHIRCDRHRRPAVVWPVRVRAGAFDDRVPSRDLWLSPDHAVFTQGVLIPVRHLINDASITQVAVDAITYWHVELSRHGVILANGLPAESYLDTGNRAMFANGAAHLALHPDFTALGWGDACARLVTAGPEIAIARRHLRARAKRLGWRCGPDGSINLRVGSRTLRPARSNGGRHCFLVPAGTKAAQIETAGSRIDGILVDGRVLRPSGPAGLGNGHHIGWRELALPPMCRVLEILLARTLRADDCRGAGARVRRA